MSKRKENTPEKATHFKKARIETSLYTLLNFKSKNSIHSEKDETEQKSTETEIISELHLLLDHLTNENVDNIEKYLKKISKNEKKKNNCLRYTSLCLQSVLNFMLNSKDLSDIILHKLEDCFKSVKMEEISVVKLSEFLNMFTLHTLSTSEIDFRIMRVISSIAKILTKNKSQELQNNVHSMFFQILSSCRLNENLLLHLLEMLNQMHHAKSDPKEAKLLLNTIFGITDQTRTVEEFKTNLNDQKFYTADWSILSLDKLISSSLTLVSNYLPEMRSFVFEKSIESVIFAKQSLTDKLAYNQLQISTVEKIMAIVNNKQAKLKKSVSEDFVNAFQTIIKRHSLKATLSRFFIFLFFSAFENIDKKLLEQMIKTYMDNLKELFDKCIHIKQSLWLEKCSDYKNLYDQVLLVFDVRQLEKQFAPGLIAKNSVDLCKYILTNYIVNGNSLYTAMPSNISEYFNNFVSTIFVQLVKSKMDFKHSRLSFVIFSILNGCFISNSEQETYVNQLELFLKNREIQNLINEDSSEMITLRKSIVARLNGSNRNSKLKNSYKDLTKFKSINLALRLLDCVGFLLYKINSEVNILIQNLCSFSFDENSLRISVFGLLSILKSIALKSSDRDNDAIQLNNKKQSELILYKLKKLIVRFDKIILKDESISFLIIELKATIYQSFSKVVKLNKALTSTIAEFLIEQLKKVVFVQSNGDEKLDSIYLFNFERCLTTYKLFLVEPVDILFHCSILVTENNLKDTDKSCLTDKPLMELRNLIQMIYKTYKIKTSQEIFEVYSGQTIQKIKKQEIPARSMLILHQLELGLIDALIENVVIKDQYQELANMLVHYKVTSGLVSNEIKQLMTNKPVYDSPSSSSLQRKRKNESSKSTNLKKSKTNKENPIDAPIKNKTNILQRVPFANILNGTTATEVTNSCNSINVADKSYMNIQFNYTPRISYTCSMKMLHILHCSENTDFTTLIPKFDKTDNPLIGLIINQNYMDYAIKNIEKKLKNLLVSSSNIYDPENLDSEEIFNFLSDIWIIMCQKINGSSGENGESTFNHGVKQNFSSAYLVKIHKYMVFCDMIWSIVQKRFQIMTPKMIENERKKHGPNNPDLTYAAKKNPKAAHTRLTWKFLLNCSKTVKLYMTTKRINQAYAAKCCSTYLAHMLNVLKTVDLSSIEYENFYQWLCFLSDQPMASENDIFKSIINLFIYLSNKQATSAIIIKFMLMDYTNYMKLMYDTQNNAIVDSIDKTTQFSLISITNVSKYRNFILEKLVELIQELKWIISSAKNFNNFRLIDIIFKQLDQITMSINFAMKSILNRESVCKVLKLLAVFYELMSFLINSDIVESNKQTISGYLNDLIDLVVVRLQTVILSEWIKIKEFIINEEEIDEKQTNMDDIFGIDIYTKLVENTEIAIKNFEDQIETFSYVNKHINLKEKLMKFSIKNLDFGFNSKVTRTISVSQINYINKQGNEI